MTEQSPGNLTDRQRHWLERIQACDAAGITLKAYADQHGFEVKTLYHWKKALVKKGILPRSRSTASTDTIFQRAQIVSQPASQCSIRLSNGIQIGLSGAIDEKQLAMILKVTASL